MGQGNYLILKALERELGVFKTYSKIYGVTHFKTLRQAERVSKINFINGGNLTNGQA